MAAIAENKKPHKTMMGVIIMSCVLLVGIFVAVFLSTNNIQMSFDAFSSNDKYRAAAFVNKRKGLLTATVKDLLPNTKFSSGADLSANIAFDTSDKKVKLSVHDKNNNPVSRILVVGTVSRVGQKGATRQIKLKEHSKGDFRSEPLDLADGGWVLMVSAYDPYTLNKDKLLFHTERAIFLKKE